ncbi:opsin, ultraviolet-sensitive-like isoform X2 [Rhodnius prolixus]
MHRFFTEEYLKLVNTHWFEYPPPNKQIHYIFAAVYFLVMLVGVSGNLLVIFMILSFRTLRTSSNILILNLAVSDFLMVAKMPVFIYNSFYFGPVLGEMGCHFYGFIGGLSGTASILTLAAIAMDRYLGIAHPLNFNQGRAKKRTIVWITFIWVYSITFASIPLSHIGVKTYVPEGFLTSCSFDYLSTDIQNRCFIFIYFVAAWCLPLLVIITSYVGICREVLRVSLIRKGQEREQRKREAKLSAILALATFLWFLSWTPYAAVALLGIFGYKNHITQLASMIPALFCKTAACVNPFIYGLNHPRLRQQLLKLCCKKRYNLEKTHFSRSWRNTSCSFKLKEQSLCNVSQSRLRRTSTVASEPSEHSTHFM